MKRVMLVATLAIALWSCGKKKQELAAGSGSSTPGSGSVNGSNVPPMVDENPTTAVVDQAFGGKRPAFPQLSKDGSAAIVELETPVGLSGVTTYSVAYIVAANAVPQPVTLVDAKLVQLLLHSVETNTPPTFDKDTMSKTAATITKRLADEGFTAFEGSVEVPMTDTIAAGPFKLQVTDAQQAAITIMVADPKGTQIANETIQPMPMGKVGEIECASLPVARKAWFDTARKRVLLQIGWNAGPDQCDGPDDQYRLFAAP